MPVTTHNWQERRGALVSSLGWWVGGWSLATLTSLCFIFLLYWFLCCINPIVTASPVEYDVPKCKKGLTGCSINPVDGSWMHTITGTYQGIGKLAAAHFHCHAPTCLSIAMYRCDKDVKICNATTGELLCEEKPIYGGTGKIPKSMQKYDEPGYILQPPCLWGSSQYGLEAPVDVNPDKYVLGSVKTSNASYGHHGEMAWQQMYVVLDGEE